MANNEDPQNVVLQTPTENNVIFASVLPGDLVLEKHYFTPAGCCLKEFIEKCQLTFVP